MRTSIQARFASGRRQAQPGSDGRARPGPADDRASTMALLEALNRGDSTEIFRRAIEKEVRELIARSRRLRITLAIAPEIAGPIVAETLDAAGRPVVSGWRDAAGRSVQRSAFER